MYYFLEVVVAVLVVVLVVVLAAVFPFSKRQKYGEEKKKRFGAAAILDCEGQCYMPRTKERRRNLFPVRSKFTS